MTTDGDMCYMTRPAHLARLMAAPALTALTNGVNTREADAQERERRQGERPSC